MAPQTLSQLRARVALGASSLIGVQGFLTSWYWQRSLRAGEDVPLLAALTQRCCVNGGKFYGSYRNAQYYGVRHERLLAGEGKRRTLPGSYAGSKAELASWQRQSFPLSALPRQEPIRHSYFSCMPFSSISRKGLSTTPLDLSKPFKPRTVSTLSPFPSTAAALAAQASGSKAKPDTSTGKDATEESERRALSKEAGFSGRTSEAVSFPSHSTSLKKGGSSESTGKNSASAMEDSEAPWLDQPQKRMPMDPPFLYRASTAAPKGHQTQLRGRDTSIRGMHMQTKAEGKEHTWGFGGPEYAAIRWFNVPIETVQALEQWEHSCQELALANKLTQFAAPGGTEEALLTSRLDLESRLNRGLSDSPVEFPSSAEEMKGRRGKEKVGGWDAALKEARESMGESQSLLQGKRVSESTAPNMKEGYRIASISQTAEEGGTKMSIYRKDAGIELDTATGTEVQEAGTMTEGCLEKGEKDQVAQGALRTGAGESNEGKAPVGQRSAQTELGEGQTDASVAEFESEAAEVCPHKGESRSTRGAQDGDLIAEGVSPAAEGEGAAQRTIVKARKEDEAGVLKGDARQSQEMLGATGEAVERQHMSREMQRSEDSGVLQDFEKGGLPSVADASDKRPKISGKESADVRRGGGDVPKRAASEKRRIEARGGMIGRSGEDRRGKQEKDKRGEDKRASSVRKSPQSASEKFGGDQVGTLQESRNSMASSETGFQKLSWAELIAPTVTSELELSAYETSTVSESAEAVVKARPQKLSWAELIAPRVANSEEPLPARKLSWAELMQPTEMEEQPAAVDARQKAMGAVDDLRPVKKTAQVEDTRQERVGGFGMQGKRQGSTKDEAQKVESRLRMNKAGKEKEEQPAILDAIQGSSRAFDGPRPAEQSPQVFASLKETPKARANTLTAQKERQGRVEVRAHRELKTREKAQQHEAVWEEWRKGKDETRDQLVAKLVTATSLGEVQRCMDAYTDDVMPKDALQVLQALREKGQLLPAYHFFSWANLQPALAANRFLLAQALPIAAQIGRLGEFEQMLFDDLSAFRKLTTYGSPETSISREEGAGFEGRAVEGAVAFEDGRVVEDATAVEPDRAPLLAETFLCNTLLEAYIEQGRWQEALGVFDRMQAPQIDLGEDSGKETAPESGAHVEARSREETQIGDREEECGKEREDFGEERDSREGQIIREDYGWLEETFQAWMHHDIKRRRGLRDWKDGLHLELPRGMISLDVLGPRDVFSFNLAMRACLRGSSELAHIWALREELEREGLVPDRTSYNLTIVACCKLPEGSAHFNARARAEDALLLVEEMEARGLSPNVHTYTAAINAWAQANTAVARALGRAESSVMVSVFERMLHEGESPNVVTYGALVGGFARMGALEDAELAVEDMLAAGTPMNQGVINAFLAGCELGGEFGRARNFVERLRDRGLTCSIETQTRLLSVRVNTGGATAVVDACEKAGRSYIEGMRRLRSEIMGAETALEQREPLNEGSAEDVAVDANGQVTSESVRSDDVALYKILIQAFVKAGRFEGLAPVLLEMAHRQCASDLVTYNVVLDACARSQDWEITDQIVEALGQLASLDTAGRTPTGSSSKKQEPINIRNPSWHAANLELPSSFLAAASELLATQMPDEDVKKRAQSLMSILRARGEPPKTVLAFFSSLCDALWSFGWEKRVSLVAGSLLGPGFQRGFKDRRPLSSATDREWSLDVRRLGKGAGQAILMLWLKRAREDFLGGERPPMKLAIVTGYGGRKWGRGELNEVVGELLRSLGAPFWVTHRNPGRFTANGYEVCEWLIEDGMEAKLSLSDGTSEVEEVAAEAY